MDEILHESKLTLFHPQCADVFGSGVQSGDIISDRKRIFLNQVRYEIIKTRFEAYLQMVEISPQLVSRPIDRGSENTTILATCGQ